MKIPPSPHPLTREGALGRELSFYAAQVHEESTAPDEVLNNLNDIVSKYTPVNVLFAALFPAQGGWTTVKDGETLFLHRSAPKGWWDHYVQIGQTYDAPGLAIARMSLAPFTYTETMQKLIPLGFDRWPYEVSLKYGIRDAFMCCLGRRWIVNYWSKEVLCDKNLTMRDRAFLFMGASFAAMRLETLIGPSVERVGQAIHLSPRELLCLRLASYGHTAKKTAELAEIGEETVRSHLKKAQKKLGATNVTHAICRAIRLGFIP